MTILIVIIGVLCVLALFGIVIGEAIYYEKHPEKEMPEVSMWP